MKGLVGRNDISWSGGGIYQVFGIFVKRNLVRGFDYERAPLTL
jgi:hypothetical protein